MEIIDKINKKLTEQELIGVMESQSTDGKRSYMVSIDGKMINISHEQAQALLVQAGESGSISI